MVAIRKSVATAVDVEILLSNAVAFSTGFAFDVEIVGAKAEAYDVHGLEYCTADRLGPCFASG